MLGIKKRYCVTIRPVMNTYFTVQIFDYKTIWIISSSNFLVISLECWACKIRKSFPKYFHSKWKKESKCLWKAFQKYICSPFVSLFLVLKSTFYFLPKRSEKYVRRHTFLSNRIGISLILTKNDIIIPNETST